MKESYHQAYARLVDFVAKHPEIEIGESVTCIPENVRPEFYGLFNAARNAFVQEKFPEHLADAGTLRENYNKAAAETAQWISFEDPPLVSVLQRYLHDPKDSMARELFDPLFDLLKGRESLDRIEKKASSGIEEAFPALFRGGYEKWVVLSLLSLFEVDKAFRVNTRNLNSGERAKPPAQAPLEEVPAPQESLSFFFSQPRNAIFAVPDFIVHSSKLNRFVGIRSEFQKGFYNALNASREREWLPINHDLLAALDCGPTLVYAAEKTESLALVADVAKFCRPDLVLWCIDSRTRTHIEALNTIVHFHSRLSPPRGSFLIANEPWPEAGDPAQVHLQSLSQEQAARIHLLTVGFDKSKLKPVAEALADIRCPAINT
jgi:hypothetical protein